MRHSIQANFKQILFLRTAKTFLTTIVFVSVMLGAIFTLTTNITQGRALSELTPMNIFSANMLGGGFRGDFNDCFYGYNDWQRIFN